MTWRALSISPYRVVGIEQRVTQRAKHQVGIADTGAGRRRLRKARCLVSLRATTGVCSFCCLLRFARFAAGCPPGLGQSKITLATS